MTSNVGAKLITENKKLGFSNSSNEEEKNKIDYENAKKDIMQEVKKEFRPEFINRIDEIIVFHKLEEEDVEKILDLMLSNLIKRLEIQGYTIEIDDSVKKYIIEQGIDKNYGARPLRRAVQTIVEDTITDGILNGEIKTNEKKILLQNDGKIVIK